MLWDTSSSSPILPVCNSHEEKCSRRDSRHGCQGWLGQQSPPLTDLLSHRKHTEGFSGCLEFGSNHRALRDGTFWESGTRALWCLSWVPCLTLSHLALIGCLLCCELPEKGPQEKNQCLSGELSRTSGTDSSMTAWKHNSKYPRWEEVPTPWACLFLTPWWRQSADVLTNAQARFLPDHSHCEAVGYRVRGTTYFYLVAEPGWTSGSLHEMVVVMASYLRAWKSFFTRQWSS